MFRSVSPDCGIAVNLKASGLVAIDWDKYKGDKEDEDWVEALEHDQLLNGCLLHKSPQGGYHFILDDGGIEKFPGHAGLTIDIKHDGYVLWPPTNGYERLDGSLEDVATIQDELVQEIEAASRALRKSLGATGTGAMMFATKDEALAALLRNVEGRRHDALARITLDIVKENPGASMDELMSIAIAELEGATRGIDKARRAELLDDREGGELWRLLEGAGAFTASVDQATLDAVREKVGRLKPVKGKERVSYTTWTSEEELLRQEQKAAAERMANHKFNYFELTDTCTLPPIRWVYGSHYIKGVVSVTAAKGGTGKSTLALAEAVLMAANQDMMGVTIHNKPKVFYWNGEDSRDMVAKKVQATCWKYGIKAEDISRKLVIEAFDTFDMRLMTGTDKGHVSVNEALVDRVKALISEAAFDVVIFDPFVACHQGMDENSNTQMEQLMSVMREIANDCQVAVEVVHHTTKGSEKAQGVDQVRGASAVVNAARAVRMLAPVEETQVQYWRQPKGTRLIQVTPVKANLSRNGEGKFVFGFEEVPLLNGDGLHPAGDVCPVAVKFRPPEKLPPYTEEQMVKAALSLANCDPDEARADTRTSGWAGYVVARALGLDVGYGLAASEYTAEIKVARRNVLTLLSALEETGVIERIQRPDNKRNMRPVLLTKSSAEAMNTRISKVYKDIGEVFDDR